MVISSKILRVDLTSGAISQESAEKYEERFIGGRGVNSFILFNEIKPETKPLDPENVLVWGVGPLAGSRYPCSAYLIMSSKNVMTGGTNWAAAGGFFAAELRHAGWGNIVISGKSPKPVYLHIKDGDVELRDASHLWGKDVWEAQDTIRQELDDPKLRFTTIGPAGENLVKFGIPIVDRTRAPSSGGMGAIMGSKLLKAVAVRGTGKTEIADSKRLADVAADVRAKIAGSAFMQVTKEKGCFGGLDWPAHEQNMYPYRNTQNEYDEHYSDIEYSKFKKAKERWTSCYNCPLQCNADIFEVDYGPYKGLKIQTFQDNTIYTFGTRCDMRDPAEILKAWELISRNGMDNDSCGCVISWAFECFEKGILTKDDTDGLDLTWGNGEAVLELVRKIIRREGFGDLLAEGCKIASGIIGKGSDYYCEHCKGQDNLDTLRSNKAWSLGNVTSLRGGKHLDGAARTEFLEDSDPSRDTGTTPEDDERMYGVRNAGDPAAYEGKGKLDSWHSHYKAAIDSLGVCYFTSWWFHKDMCGPEDYARALSAASGREISGDEFMEIGHRIHAVDKAFNTLHAGFTRKDDYPPLVFTNVPTKGGRQSGAILDLKKWDVMLDEYYEFQGWDKKTSWQKESELAKLKIPEVIERLRAAGKLL